ncbi:MAG: hypothetical protein WBD31_29015 [Rubripirellula sp.]
MLMLPTTASSPLINQAYVRSTVSLATLDEPTAYEQLDAYFEREFHRRSLRQAAGIDDGELLDRLVDAGFTSDTVPALQLAPIALIAWASDSVSDEESQAAVWSIYENRLFSHPAAASRVQSWIDVRPDESLWGLWQDYTECRLQSLPSVVRQLVGKQLLQQASDVALASGGFLGVGKICAAEQAILDTIRSVYRLE